MKIALLFLFQYLHFWTSHQHETCTKQATKNQIFNLKGGQTFMASIKICALSTNSHYILLVVQKFYWMSQTYFLFTIYDNIYTTQWNNISSNWNIWIPIFLLYLHKSPEVRTPLSYCTLMYIMHFVKLHSRYELYTSIIHPLYYTICAWFSSQLGFAAWPSSGDGLS